MTRDVDEILFVVQHCEDHGFLNGDYFVLLRHQLIVVPSSQVKNCGKKSFWPPETSLYTTNNWKNDCTKKIIKIPQLAAWLFRTQSFIFMAKQTSMRMNFEAFSLI